MNVCDYCGAVYNDTCGGCAAPHVILYYKAAQAWTIDLRYASRAEAEEKFDERMVSDGWDYAIIQIEIWKAAMQALIDGADY